MILDASDAFRQRQAIVHFERVLQACADAIEFAAASSLYPQQARRKATGADNTPSGPGRSFPDPGGREDRKLQDDLADADPSWPMGKADDVRQRDAIGGASLHVGDIAGRDLSCVTKSMMRETE